MLRLRQRGIIIVKLMIAGPAALFASNKALAISEPAGALLYNARSAPAGNLAGNQGIVMLTHNYRIE